MDTNKTIQRPIFRWAGSKRQLVPTLMRHVPAHERYIEPFVGSACLYFSLNPQRALLGDINRDLISAYRTIRSSAAEVATELESMPVTKTFYYQLRSANATRLPVTQRTARFIYLNRFCFNGVYRTNKQGRFNVPRGIRTGTLPGRNELLAWAETLSRARFKAGDFRACLDNAGAGDFVYLDPPYSKPGIRNRGEYGYDSFSELDIPRLAQCLTDLDDKGATFLLSYRYSAGIVAAFPMWHRRAIIVRRHVAGFVSARTNVREVLFSNLPLQGARH